MRSSRRSNNLSRSIGQGSLTSIDPSPSGCSLARNVSLSSVSSMQQENANELDSAIMGTELTIMYFACKSETFQLRKNFKRFLRFLKSHLPCSVIPLTKELGDGLLSFCNLLILAGPNEPLSQNELALLFEYVQNGGSVFVLAESNAPAQIYNDFTRRFGIVIQEDSVISVIRRKQYHPKECLVSNAVICPTLFPAGGAGGDDEENIDILYPYGCSLNVKNSLAAPIVASGTSSYPCSRPLGAIYYNAESKGRVVVLGSGHAFADEFIGMEDNRKLLELLLDVLVTEDELELVVRDADLMDHEDFYCTGLKAGRFRGVLQDIDEYVFPGAVNPIMNGSFKPMNLMSSNIGRLDFSLLNEVFNAYDQLQLERVPLAQSVKPQMEAQLFQPKLAVFPPTFRNLPPPALELYDLDEEFSSVDKRLGRLVNKCSDGDLEFFVESMGDLLGVSSEDSKNRATSILHKMLMDLVNFKMPRALPGQTDSDTMSTTSALSMIDDKYFCHVGDGPMQDEDSGSEQNAGESARS